MELFLGEEAAAEVEAEVDVEVDADADAEAEVMIEPPNTGAGDVGEIGDSGEEISGLRRLCFDNTGLR